MEFNILKQCGINRKQQIALNEMNRILSITRKVETKLTLGKKKYKYVYFFLF